jgi:imidazole glycerol-phosphate synthase subunit HisF
VAPPRVMPCLLLRGSGLVKTVKFKDPTYLGDPRNAVKIFNEKEVDELILLDITATPEQRQPRFDLVQEIVSEAFMPVAYGGGIRTIEDARRMLQLGVEKIVVCTRAIEDPAFVTAAADLFGSQSVVVCLDVRRTLLGRYEAYTHGGRTRTRRDPVSLAEEMAGRGAGEIVVNSIDRDGTMAGYDVALVRSVSSAVNVPVIACGGAGSVEHLAEAVRLGGASAVAAGSMFVFQGRHRAVLISFPAQADLRTAFAS